MLLIMLFNRTAGVLSLCDRHASEKLLLCRQGESHSHSQWPLYSSLLPMPRAPANSLCREWSEAWKQETCSTLKKNRTQVYSCPWSRIKTTVFHGSQIKKYKNRVDANIEPIYLTNCFLWSHAQLYFPEQPGQRTPSYLPNSNTLQPVEDFSWALPW